MSDALIEALRDPARYPHPVARVERMETHISWILLAGDYAYKIRKPVDFGFLDFTTLEKRRQDCEEELRLNRRLSPHLYLGLSAIGGSPAAPVLDGAGPAFEYAVKMHRFDQGQLLSHQQQQGRLTAGDMDALAALLAKFHDHCPPAAPDSDYGTLETLADVVGQNFVQARQRLPEGYGQAPLAALEAWSRQRLQALAPLIRARRAEGRVRECHGDLHLGNIARVGDRISPFDCIEFNPRYRWVDCLNDLAFLLMDLEHRGEPGLAQRLLDRYLALSGDYRGVPLLPLFKAYRAMVRAKVALLSAPPGDAAARAEFEGYLRLATAYGQSPPPMLVLMHGVSGSGKSWLAERLLERGAFIRLRSDVERRRLHPEAEGRYTPAMDRRTYARLRELSDDLLKAAVPVIVDATFLRRKDRHPFQALAEALGIPLQILCCEAGLPTLEARILQRTSARSDPSEATVAVMRQQWLAREPLDDAERRVTWVIDTGVPDPLSTLPEALR